MTDGKLILMKGLPASGKTTWAEKLARDKSDHCIVSRDAIRAMLKPSNYKVGAYEDLVKRCRDHLVRILLLDDQGLTVIVDETSMKAATRKHFKRMAEEADAHYSLHDMRVQPYLCIERDARRDNPVGEHVIRNMWETQT